MSKTMSEKTTTAKIKLSVADLDFEKQGGLLPVVAQDVSTGAVLMMAYANQEAVQKLRNQDLHTIGHVLVVLSGKKEKVQVTCRKLWRYWWIVIKIPCFTESINLGLLVILVGRPAFSRN